MSTTITYQNIPYELHPGETVLELFIRRALPVPFSCQAGVCQVCVMRCLEGDIPPDSQKALKRSLLEKQYFMPCQCVPSGNMLIADARPEDLFGRVTVTAREALSPSVCRLLLEPATPLYYHAGQYINLKRPDGVVRSYSLASFPQEDELLEIHVKRIPGGEMSNWLFDDLELGQQLEIQGPQGYCYYQNAFQTQNILLIATGSGLSPLWGIVRDALANGHQGNIYVYHGSRNLDGLYYQQELKSLTEKHPQFHYIPCLSGDHVPEGYSVGRAHDLALQAHPDLSQWVVFACGHPEMVQDVKGRAFNQGAHLDHILTDAFIIAQERHEDRLSFQHIEEEHVFPPPDPEMWAALENGALLSKILNDFYEQVFSDARLLPFFKHTTKYRLVEKVYSFWNEIFTGKDVYFGQLPRNAHHWMVISDELFDYRARIKENTLRRHGLPEHLIRRWVNLEEGYRRHIVKSEPWGKMAFGKEFPIDGYDEMELDCDYLCDGCSAEIKTGETVRYHRFKATIYCTQCAGNLAESA